MTAYPHTTRKSKAQRELERATELLRKPGACLALMHTNNPLVCGNDKRTMGYFILGKQGRQIPFDVAQKLIGRPDVRGSYDGLLPGHHQIWRFI
jgi:hypothetical protein